MGEYEKTISESKIYRTIILGGIMIFVTLGTQDKPFKRLLDLLQKEIDLGVIQEEVVVQAGVTQFESKDMKIIDFLSQKEFEKYMKKCRLLITHGGVGSILTGLRYEKKVIAVPRLLKYGEHESDHQVQIIDEFVKKGYILGLNDYSKFQKVFEKAETFKPKKYVSNRQNFIDKMEHYIDFGTL